MTRRRPGKNRRTRLPVDADVPGELPPAHRRAAQLLRQRWDILLAIAGGGALGSLARWALTEAFAHHADEVAWGTAIANVSGAFVLGALMVFVLEAWPTTRYVRPFFGVGVLGGYTTFSTYMLDTRGLLVGGEAPLAFAYLFGTLLLGLLAVAAGVAGARAVVRGPTGPRPEPAVADDQTDQSDQSDQRSRP